MKTKINIKDNCLIIIIVILIISFALNIYQAVLNKRYCYEIGEKNYNKIEEILFILLSFLDSIIANSQEEKR